MRRASFAGALLIASLMASGAQAQRVTNIETQGNLAPNFPIGCISLDAVPAASNPVDLYAATLACVQADDFVQARELMLVGDIRGRFDAGRVNDTTASAAWAVAKQNVQRQFTPEQRTKLEDAFKALGDNAIRCALGERIRDSGAPDYVPTYMIRHGMGATISNDANAVTAYHDPAAAYGKVVSSYLGCPLTGGN